MPWIFKYPSLIWQSFLVLLFADSLFGFSSKTILRCRLVATQIFHSHCWSPYSLCRAILERNNNPEKKTANHTWREAAGKKENKKQSKLQRQTIKRELVYALFNF